MSCNSGSDTDTLKKIIVEAGKYDWSAMYGDSIIRASRILPYVDFSNTWNQTVCCQLCREMQLLRIEELW
jgi:hypothetical protein